MASENAMVANMFVQTTEQLTKRYNLAGFRFDLMGLLTTKSMAEVDVNLRAFDSDIILYGEGWDMYNGDVFLGNAAQSKQGAFRNSDESKENKIGFFNDVFRDGVKGSVFNADEKGYLQAAYEGSGTKNAKNAVLFGLYGSQNMAETGKASWVSHFSGASVNYVEAHDNLTLHDKLYATNPEMTVSQRNEMQTLANAMVSLSTGVAFYQLGQEFARSKEMPASWLEGPEAVTEKYTKVGDGADAKYFVNDSYNFSDEINAVDWTLIRTNQALISAFKADLALRHSPELSCLRPQSFDNYQYSSLTATAVGLTADAYLNALGYSISFNGSVAANIVFNAASQAATLTDSTLAAGAQNIYVNGVKVSTLPASLPAASYLVITY